MTELLTELAASRRRLLAGADALTEIWHAAQTASGSESSQGLVTADLSRLRDELERRTFTIGLFGLIKRGKSTLLNALLGSELSPTHVTPETAVPVYVAHGDQPQATVHFADGSTRDIATDDVAYWTSQKHNVRNRLGVTHVAWRFPSPLLRNGVRIVDTPGLDDAEADELYTRRTVQELEVADAGILVFSSPPTVGATEMAFLREVTTAQIRNTLLVANLYPQHYDDPEVRREVTEYVRRQVAEGSGVRDVVIHAVCAQSAWEARERGDEEAWRKAGGAALLEALEDAIETNTGHRAIERVQAALQHTAEVARGSIELQIQALDGALETGRQDRVRRHGDRLSDGEDRVLENRLREVASARTQLDALVNGLFVRTRATVQQTGSVEELEKVLSRFGREVVVVTEDAYRHLHAQLLAIHNESARKFDAGVAATLHELGAVRPSTAGAQPGDGRPVTHAPLLAGHTGLQGAAVGGALAGGTSFVLAGSLLGPLGALVGALVGWKLGSIVRSGRELRSLREEVATQIGEVADAVLAEFDARVDDLVAAVRAATRQRRLGFAADLNELLAVLDRLGGQAGSREEAAATLRTLTLRLDGLDFAVGPGTGSAGPGAGAGALAVSQPWAPAGTVTSS